MVSPKSSVGSFQVMINRRLKRNVTDGVLGAAGGAGNTVGM